MSQTEIKFIEHLRQEAESVKDCYTKFSFQSWVFSVAALGIIVRFVTDTPIAGFLAILPLIILLSVGRIGIHKYTTANRIYGFELYINRRRRYVDVSTDLENTKSQELLEERAIGWEEAYYSWRLVQSSLYSATYRDRKRQLSRYFRWGLPIRVRKINGLRESVFFKTEWSDRVKIYPGSYLHVNFWVMNFFCLICLITMVYSSYCIYAESQSFTKPPLFAVCVTVLVAIAWLLRAWRLDSRRVALETGLLSINSCAIIWSLAIKAHLRAVDNLRQTEDGQRSFEGYTDKLADETQDLVDKYFEGGVDALYEWRDKGKAYQLSFDFI